LRLQPTSQWQIDYAADHCRLARQFGEGENKVLAIFDKYGPDGEFKMTIAGQPMRTRYDKDGVSLQFGPAEEKQELEFFIGKFGEQNALIFRGGARIAPPTTAERQAIKNKKAGEWIELTPITPAREAAVRYIEIGKPLRRAVILETGSLKQPMAALDKCVDELVSHWGVDVEKHKSLTRKAAPIESPGRWITTDDYPTAMLNAGQPALVEFRLNVGADGIPTACHIQATTRPQAFDDAVCKSLMRRAKFEPALDSGGKPLESYWRNTVNFRIPTE
jgi:Gram-negative bacterial TonB protein C-terminal